MKIMFHPNKGPARKAKLPYTDADYCVVDGECPYCKAMPFHAAGVKGTMVKGHATLTSDAGCIGCKVVTGKLVVKVNTLFGIEEDERVMRSGVRIY